MRTACHLLFLTATLCGLGACGSTSHVLEDSRRHAEVGNYYLAYKVLEEARDPDHPDPGLEQAYWEARLAFLLDEGMRKIFLNHEEEAIQDLNQALALDPDNEQAKSLLRRAHLKLAQRATRLGERHLIQGQLEEALLAFTEAQRHVPEYPPAVEGTAKVRAEFEKMHRLAQQHFLQALRKWPELRTIEVDWHAMVALENDPSRTDAKKLRDLAVEEMARKLFERAQASEQEGLYGAAQLEYRGVKELVPDFPQIDEHIAHMQREVEAQALVEEAFMLVLRQDFDAAREKLNKAFDLTVLEKSTISEMMVQAQQRQLEAKYQHARDLELQHRYDEALATYKAIDEEWSGGFKDVKTRISSLELDMQSAFEAWERAEKAEQAGDHAAALEAYEEVQLFYPGYKDVEERIARLQKLQAQSKPAEMGKPAEKGKSD